MRRASTVVAAAAALVLAACGNGAGDEEVADPSPPPSPTAAPEPEDADEPDEPDEADEPDGADPGDEGAAEEPTPDDDARDVEPVAGTWTTETSTEEHEGTRLVVTDLRVGAHEGFDRVTFEIEGDGAPGWRILYEDDPRQQGSGHAVDVAGDAAMHVSLTSFAYPMDAPAEPRDGPQRIEPTRTAAVIEILDDSLFEGHHDFWIGVDDRRPYRVAMFEDPTRVVIDIETG